MTEELPEYLDARVGEYRAPGERHVRITAEGCVASADLYMLAAAEPIERNVSVAWGDEIKPKRFTRLKVKSKYYLAERVTGTLYNEATGLSSSLSLRLV